jgi:hypothetical protein
MLCQPNGRQAVGASHGGQLVAIGGREVSGFVPHAGEILRADVNVMGTCSGMDQHSLVAEPIFVDPQHDDYRLKPESPALKPGFQPIPMDQTGPYESKLRASWPIVEAEGAGEKPLVTD